MISYVIGINIMAYTIMCYDKYQSKKNGQRIAENTLLLLAFFFGSLGIYMGMKAPIYHKTSKNKFKFGVPVLFLTNIASVYFLYKFY